MLRRIKIKTYRDRDIMVDVASVQFPLESKDCVGGVDEALHEYVVLGWVHNGLTIAMLFHVSILK